MMLIVAVAIAVIDGAVQTSLIALVGGIAAVLVSAVSGALLTGAVLLAYGLERHQCGTKHKAPPQGIIPEIRENP